MNEGASSDRKRRGFSLMGAIAGLAVPLAVMWLTGPRHWAPPVLADGSWQRPTTGLAAWQLYGWPALGISAIQGGLLGALLPWWWPRPSSARATCTRHQWKRWEVILAAGLMLLGCAVRAPLMTAELHRDEQDNLAHQIHGMYRLPPQRRAPGPPPRPGAGLPDRVQEAVLSAAKLSGKVVWAPRTWSQTWLESPAGNNSPLNSALSRLCNTGWQWAAGSPPQRFSLVALRLPAFLAITAATLLLFAVLRRWCAGPWPAALGCLSFALHPLVIRYGALSRGYALMLLFLVAVLYAWTRALDGSFRTGWCFMAAGAVGAAVWCFPGFALTGAGLSVGLLLAALPAARGARWEVLRQWAGAHLAAFALWLPIVTPMAVQTAFVMAYDFPMRSDHLAWLPRYLGAGLCGMILPTKEQLPFNTGTLRSGLWKDIWDSAPVGSLLVFVLVPTLVVTAILALRARRHPAAIAISALVLGAAITAVSATWGQHKQLLYWYACYLAPVAAIGWAALGMIARQGALRIAVAVMAIASLAIAFPAGRTGRLPLFPPTPFKRLATLYRGYWIVSGNEGINVSIPAR